MATKVKVELEEEVRLSTSGGGAPTQEPEEKSESGESMESDEIDDEFITNYCESTETIQPITSAKSCFTRMKWWPGIMLDCPNKIKNDSIR